MKKFLKNLIAVAGMIFILYTAHAQSVLEPTRLHARESLAMAVFDTVVAPRWCGEFRMRIAGSDTSVFVSNCRSVGRRWFHVTFTDYKIQDVDVIRWNTYTYVVNGSPLDTLVYQINDSTFRIKSIRTVGSNGLSVTPTIDASSVLYNVGVTAFSTFAADSTTTTNATPTTLRTFTLDPNSIGVITVQLTGIKTDGSGGITGIKTLRYKKVGSTLTLGTPAALLADEVDAAVSGATWSITTSSNNIIIQVTGVASTTIDWRITSVINRHTVFP